MGQNLNTGKKDLSLLEFLAGFALSLLICLAQAYLLSSPLDHLYSDMGGYIERAKRLAGGGPYYPFDYFYPPGTHYLFSLVFWACGYSLGLELLVVLQALALAGTNLLFSQSTQKLFHNRIITRFTLWGSMLYWPFAAQASFFMAEPAFSLFVAFSLFFFVHALIDSKSFLPLLLSALFLAGATLIKSQALLCAFGPGLMLLLEKNSRLKLVRFFLFIAALALPLILQSSITTSKLNQRGFVLSANDAFNLYLGQSRREALGCLAPKEGVFYVFHNNNAGLDYPLYAPKMLYQSILDRSSFIEKTKALWQENPKRQLLFGAQSVVELFAINPRWPLRNISQFRVWDLRFQWLFFFLVLAPSTAGLLLMLKTPARYLAPLTLLLLPVVFIAATAFITMGQPRYLLPFLYYFFPLAGFWFSNLKTKPSPSLWLSLAVASLLLYCLYFLGLRITEVYSAMIPPRIDGSEQHYFNPIPELNNIGTLSDGFSFAPVHLIELGKGGKLFSPKQPNSAFKLEISGFTTAVSWPRQVAWHISAASSGTIDAHFPAEHVQAIAFYLSDGDSFWRSARITSGEQEHLAKSLHDGRWYVFPVTEAETKTGRKSFVFQRLTGDSVSLSAVIFLRIERNS